MTYNIEEDDSYLSKLIVGFFENTTWATILATLLIYLQAVYINRIVIKNRLVTGLTLVPGMVFCILASFFLEHHRLSPHMIANGFVLTAISQIFKAYKKPKAADILFNVGLFIGIASLFVNNYIYLLLPGLVAIFILRSINLKEVFQFLSGTIVVFILYHGIQYLRVDSVSFTLDNLAMSPRFSLFNPDMKNLYITGGMVLISIFTVFNYGTYTLKKSIQAQKKIDILFWILLTSPLLVFFHDVPVIDQALLAFFPMSIFLSINLLRINKPLTQELVHVLIIVLLFLHHFFIH